MYVRTAALSLILRERCFTFCLARLRAWGEFAKVFRSFFCVELVKRKICYFFRQLSIAVSELFAIEPTLHDLLPIERV